MAAPTKAKKYDALIVGSGPEALLTGLNLQEQGFQVALVEKEEHVGGLCRPLRYKGAMYETHFSFWPETPEALTAISNLKKWIPNLEFQTLDVGPLTFNNGQVQPFLGFGEHHVPAIHEYSFFTQSPQVVLSQPIGEIIEALRAQFLGEIYVQSEVTQMLVEGEHALILNGAQKIVGQKIYFFENPHFLAKLLSHDPTLHLNKTAVPKLSKVPLWTAVHLLFHHKQEISQTPAIHVLFGAKEQPCIGRLGTQNGVPISQWLCFLSEEGLTDSEAQGAAIREMKKQIKRMYPSFLDTVEKEFIQVSKNAYGSVPASLLDKNHQLAKAPHLHLGSRFYSTIPGILGDFASLETIDLGKRESGEPVVASL